MAGAGFRTFVDGEVLTAAQVNTYLMQQAVMVFADASARSTAIAAPSEGMLTYLTGSDVLEYYDGAAWQPILDQDVISAKGDLIVGTADDTVQALTVGSNEQRLVADSGETTGLKYVADTTNYAIGAKGDLLVGTAADTLTNLAVGTDDYVLTADSNEASGLKWAAAAGGAGKVLQVVSAVYSTETTNSTSTYADTGLSASITPSAATSKALVLLSQEIFLTRTSSDDTGGSMSLLRDSTEIYETGGTSFFRALGVRYGGQIGSTVTIAGVSPMIYLDSPSTTSSVTYKTQMRRGPGSGDMVAQKDSADSSIVLLEIGV